MGGDWSLAPGDREGDPERGAARGTEQRRRGRMGGEQRIELSEVRGR